MRRKDMSSPFIYYDDQAFALITTLQRISNQFSTNFVEASFRAQVLLQEVQALLRCLILYGRKQSCHRGLQSCFVSSVD